MEMGKLTAKLRDAVPVCFLVDGKEITRYKNIEIPDELKKLEYQDFKFDVPLNGAITFRIMFEPGVLPEVFPQTRERRMRKPLAQEVQLQEEASAVDMAAGAESQPQDEQTTEGFHTLAADVAQASEDAKAFCEPVADTAVAMADGEAIKAEIIEVEGERRLVVITIEPEVTTAPETTKATAEAEVQSEDSEQAKKLTRKGKSKKSVASTEDADN